MSDPELDSRIKQMINDYEKQPRIGYWRGSNLTIIRVLSGLEYNNLQDARNAIMRFSEDQRPFLILRETINEIIQYVTNLYAEGHLKPGIDRFPIEKAIIQINKLLLNMLSAFRTYVDHFETS